MADPALRFLSLFVPDLDQARRAYAEVFGVEPVAPSPPVLEPHPCSPLSPVVFDLGGVKLALYQADGRTTHPGDVGIGVETHEPLAAVVERVQRAGGRTFVGPQPQAARAATLAVFVLPDRHFFEMLGPAPRG